MSIAGSDPRAIARSDDIRPLVARATRPLPGWVLPGVVALGALMLFAILESRRETRSAPTTRPLAADLTRLPPPPPPPLFVPPVQILASPPVIPAAPVTPMPPTIPARPTPAPPQPQITQPMFQPSFQPAVPLPTPTPIRQSTAGSALVIDTTSAAVDDVPQRPAGTVGVSPFGENALSPGSTGGRVRAGQFVNRSTTVQQGTLIPAVLETALDSTRPGQVRALVSRDVRGFDGTRILIPRGSRLFGEYRADLRPGQNRALVQWTRLVRPDGVSMTIGSPAADPLGRAGIRGKVDSHFLERFGSAILQSALDIGVAVGAQQLGGSNLVLIPGAGQALQPSIQLPIQPTLTVRQGARVTVFVANDLDFTGADVPRE